MDIPVDLRATIEVRVVARKQASREEGRRHHAHESVEREREEDFVNVKGQGL